MGLLLLVLDPVHSDLSLLLWTFVQIDSVLSVYGIGWPGLSPSAPDFAQADFLLSTRTSARIGSALLVYGLSQSEPLLFAPDSSLFGSPLLLHSFL